MNDWLIVANGAPVSSDCLVQWGENRSVCACDGAYSGLKQQNIVVDMLIGDFDSVDTGDLSHCRHSPGIECHKLPDQAKTDLEKAIEFLDDRGATSIVVVQATGYRVDHTLYNIRLLRRFYRQSRPFVLVNDHERISFHRDCDIRLVGMSGQRVSILAMDTAMISTQGLLFDMTQCNLGGDYKDSVSNSLSQSQAVLSICGEVVLVIDSAINLV